MTIKIKIIDESGFSFVKFKECSSTKQEFTITENFKKKRVIPLNNLSINIS